MDPHRKRGKSQNNTKKLRHTKRVLLARRRGGKWAKCPHQVQSQKTYADPPEGEATADRREDCPQDAGGISLVAAVT